MGNTLFSRHQQKTDQLNHGKTARRGIVSRHAVRNYNLYRLLADFKLNTSHKLEQFEQHFVIRVSPWTPQYCYGNSLQLSLLLENICEHGSFCTDRGVLVLDVDCHHDLDKNTYLSLTLTINGQGIPDRLINKLFIDELLTDADGNART